MQIYKLPVSIVKMVENVSSLSPVRWGAISGTKGRTMELQSAQYPVQLTGNENSA